MIAYLRANWKQLAGVAIAAAVAGYFAHRCPQPAVHLAEAESAQATTLASTDTTVQAGPVKVTVLEFARPENAKAPGEPEAPQRGTAGQGRLSLGAVLQGDSLPAHGPLLKATVTEQGPTTTETHAVAETQASSERKLDLTVTPATPPVWAVGVGVEDVLGARTLRLSARRRLLGPFWAEAAVQPATRTLGVGLAVEW